MPSLVRGIARVEADPALWCCPTVVNTATYLKEATAIELSSLTEITEWTAIIAVGQDVSIETARQVFALCEAQYSDSDVETDIFGYAWLEMTWRHEFDIIDILAKTHHVAHVDTKPSVTLSLASWWELVFGRIPCCLCECE